MGYFVRIGDKYHYPTDFTAEAYLSQDDWDLIEPREKAKFQIGTPGCPIEHFTKLKGGVCDLYNAHLTVYATLEGSKDIVNALGRAEDSVIEIHVMKK